ncbi:muscarinic acetylcholine receptor DM1 [Centruroides vittatus]|uniref:muscarinic acetylcholine receptor DM1 n=1 Tax=Centruroides vittatus TaxID=120091 RepID=UPI00350FD160
MTDSTTRLFSDIKSTQSWLQVNDTASPVNITLFDMLNLSNTTDNNTGDDLVRRRSTAEIIIYGFVAGLLSLSTVLGNVMVMISFKMDKQLQTISNYFLLSLAIADFSIGLISMPLFTLYILYERWPLGPFICDTWLAIDYLISNASVLNLLIISFDRYFSVTRPLTYRAKRTTKRAAFMIASAWVISLALWPPWIYAWPYIEGSRKVKAGMCYIQFLETNPFVTFGTAIAAFYVPVTVMCALYYKIWQETEKRKKELTHLQAGKKEGSKNSTSSDDPQEEEEKKKRSYSCVPDDTTYVPTSLYVPNVQKSRTQRLKERLFNLCRLDKDTDGGEEDSTSHGSQGAITPASVETPIQSSSRTTSITFKPEQIHTIKRADAVALEDRNGPRRPDSVPSTSRAPPHSISSDSVYTVLIRLPQQPCAGEEESPASIKMILEEEDTVAETKMQPTKRSESSGGISKHTEPHSRQGSLRLRESAIETLRLPLNAKLVHKQMAKHRGPKKKRKQQERKQEKKAAKTLSAILFAFILTWTPYNVLVLVKTIIKCEECISDTLWNFAYYLCYINSTVNPLCYALCNANFRRTYIRILSCKWHNERRHLANHGYFS